MKREILLAFVPIFAQADPSPLIFPDQTLPLRFSHRQHLQFQPQCDFCHENAPSSTQASDVLTPSEEVCANCHAIDRAQPQKQAKPGAACVGCHVGADPAIPQRISIPEPQVHFPHATHVAKGISCQYCHGDMKAVDLATRAQLPKMPQCLFCHDGKQASSRCTTCHLSGIDNRIRTDLPGGKLVPSGVLRGEVHHERFSVDHARPARQDTAHCLNCHAQKECLACHDGLSKPRAIHSNDYVTRHPVEARRNVPDCSSCHRVQSFCLSCHARLGVNLAGNESPELPNAFSPARRRSFHPDGWVQETGSVATPRAPTHHAYQAQRNIAACASCHREETCLRCHGGSQFTGQLDLRVNPHGPGFVRSAKCRALQSRNTRTCVRCHASGSPALSCESP